MTVEQYPLVRRLNVGYRVAFRDEMLRLDLEAVGGDGANN